MLNKLGPKVEIPTSICAKNVTQNIRECEVRVHLRYMNVPRIKYPAA